MRLVFNIEYHTAWGEEIRVEIKLNRFSNKQSFFLIPLSTQDGSHWSTVFNSILKDVKDFSYSYFVYRGDEQVRREWPVVERKFKYTHKNFYFNDYWRDLPPLSYMYSTAYLRCRAIFHQKKEEISYYRKTIIFKVQAPQLQANQVLGILGSHPLLGQWNSMRALQMKAEGCNEWSLSLSVNQIDFDFEYKYVIIERDSDKLLRWEGGQNRSFHSPDNLMDADIYVQYDHTLRVEEKPFKAAGLVVPLFALRSTHSKGIGDFSDLKRLVDWCHLCKMHIIQLLPIYDTTQTFTDSDSYPYNCISIYALHPLYIDLDEVPSPNDRHVKEEFFNELKHLDSLRGIDYKPLIQKKYAYLKTVFSDHYDEITNSEAYYKFYIEHKEWLFPYCAFSVLRDLNGTPDFTQWGEYAQYSLEKVNKLYASHQEKFAYYTYLQYLLDKQFSAVVEYARSKGIVFKGDLPIGISPYSVEAWTQGYYFNLDVQAGAPPDEFSKTGQNWGFPTYNWKRIAQDGYKWWVGRLRHMSSYFDAFRIDHILGFFRIWEIPSHSVEALLGQFSPSLPFSPEEIQRYGFPFNEETMTRPSITRETVMAIFGKESDHFIQNFLKTNSEGAFELLPQYCTQKSIEKSFSRTRLAHSPLKQGLFRLVNNVLFVRDHNDPTKFHPRISAMDDFAFAQLDAPAKEAYVRLYYDYFYRRHNEFWYQEAMKKLPALLSGHTMLACAEDLGMVPDCVEPVLKRLGILSLEIVSMPKKTGREFADVLKNPYFSVSTLFTHDMPTLRLWWKEDHLRAQRYYNSILGLEGTAPKELSAQLCQQIIMRHLQCPSMLCLLSVQDWLSMNERLRTKDLSSERINIPADLHHVWNYRMEHSIEELMEDKPFTESIQRMIEETGRS